MWDIVVYCVALHQYSTPQHHGAGQYWQSIASQPIHSLTHCSAQPDDRAIGINVDVKECGPGGKPWNCWHVTDQDDQEPSSDGRPHLRQHNTAQPSLCNGQRASDGAVQQMLQRPANCALVSPPGWAVRSHWVRPWHWRPLKKSTASLRHRWELCRNPAWYTVRSALLRRLNTPRCRHHSWRRLPQSCP
jgi:hypothetical protein